MKIVAITQARYGSSRLKAKVLKKINQETILDIHIKRIKKSKLINEIVVATTDEAESDLIVEIADRNKVLSYKGSVNDVLDRFYQASKIVKPDIIVRVTSDCPLIDANEIDKVINVLLQTKCDYASNTMQPTLPDGMDAEVLTYSALEKAYNEATLKSDREHVTPYIWRNSSFKGGNLFESQNIFNDKDYSNYRLTVDNEEDFLVIKKLVEVLGINCNWKEYVDFLDKNPTIKAINSGLKRNEGYQKSLIEDKKK
jgi:spore coat polysaccharide biosynthesis protein SpsF (cytidylyltransferase family)